MTVTSLEFDWNVAAVCETVAEEPRYLCYDTDVTSVVFHGSFPGTAGALRDRQAAAAVEVPSS